MSRDLILDRLARFAQAQPGAPALLSRAPGEAHPGEGVAWITDTWADYHRRVRAFGAACVALGLPPGGVVGILSENRPEWLFAALGAMSAGGAASGLYQTSTPDQIAYILGHSEAMLVVVENDRQWQKVKARRDRLPGLRRVVLLDGPGPEDAGDPLLQSFADFLKTGEPAVHGQEVDRRTAAIAPGDLASLIYTSGTTGEPKGVMLTHQNLAWAAATVLTLNPGPYPDDCSVSYLPMSHIAEQMLTIYVPVSGGYRVYFAGSIERVRETLLVARPTFFLGVPRVWEKLKVALEGKLAEATGLKGAIVKWARGVGLRAGRERIEHREPWGLLALEERVAERLFFRKLKAAIGFDRVRVASSGAAPISRDVLEFFLSLQIPIMEVYGQTEDCGPTSYNIPAPGKARLGTVGRPLPGLEVRLAEDGEILVRGPSVFAGYYKDPAATAETLQDGWLHSGDVGEFDEDGFLRITDRKKDLIKTSGGKYAAPQAIEKPLKSIPIVSQAVVIGESRRYLTALLTLDAERARRWAADRGLSASDLGALSGDAACVAFVQEHVDRINAGLARFETIKKFTLLPNDFTVEAGELTPSQKVRRRVVNQRYAAQIDAMYADAEAPEASPLR